MHFSDILPLIPELFLVTSTMILLMFGVFSGNRSTVGIAGVAGMTLLITLYMVTRYLPEGPQFFGTMFVSDGFTGFAKLLILIGALLALAISLRWLSAEKNKRFEYSILILFSTLGLMLMVSASDFLAVYMGLELSSLALYVLASFSDEDEKSSEAGLKYFVLGSLASGMMLFGISLVYGFAGSLQFDVLASHFAALPFGSSSLDAFPYGLVVGLVMITIGFCFKVSAAPFHMWTPDVYEGAPTPVTAFFATAPKVAAMLLLARLLMHPFGSLAFQWQQVIIFVAALSMVVGAFGGLAQTNIKRMLAYSSIGHVGFALLGLAAANEAGVRGLVVYMALYLFMSAGAFGCVLLMQRKGEACEKIDDLKGAASNHPYFAGALALLMFSMAGIPPLAGFFGKMYVFMAAIEAKLYFVTVFGLILSVVSAFYYLRIVKVMYFDEPSQEFDMELDWVMKGAIAICVVVSVCFMLKPGLLTAGAGQAVQALL